MDRQNLTENDICKLVKLVERRPEIWDKSCNKDNDKKRRAWVEIFKEFDDRDWDVIPEAEKKKLEETYKGKWTNLRDVFIKSLKGTQPYKYHDILKFLLKNVELSKNQCSPEPDAVAGPSNESSTQRKKKRYSLLARKRVAYKPKRMKMDRAQTSVLPEEDARQQSPLPDTKCIPTYSVHSTTESQQDSENVVDGDESDKHFFISILPMIKDFSTIQQLDFRLGVLNVIRDIKSSSKMVNSSPAVLTNLKQELTVSDSE